MPYTSATWHSDVTWAERPPLGSVLIAREVPSVGGDTLFVDSYAMWEGLHPTLKRKLAGAVAIHGRPTGESEAEWKGGAAAAYRTVSSR